MATLRGASGKVLVIDDDAAFRELLTIALEGSGYAIASAENGANGLNLASRFAPDVILLDLIMPVMDGMRFLRSLRTEIASNVPVIVLTCDGRRSVSVDAVVAGATEVLVKPVALSFVEERIASAAGIEARGAG